MRRLVLAYPSILRGFENNDIIWSDGTRMPFDDGVANKTFEALLDKPSLKNVFSMAYPAGEQKAPPAENFDPGRVRYAPFFDKMYGDCEKGGVAPKLASIEWLPKYGGGTVRVTTVNGIHKKLELISRQLEALPRKYIKYLTPIAGVYNCRTIAGTSRKSAHAYGAAIDINVKYSNYWMWSKSTGEKYGYRNAIPNEIINIFEKHGFIWGGKWYHFDTMHFEYRPELLDNAAGN